MHFLTLFFGAASRRFFQTQSLNNTKKSPQFCDYAPLLPGVRHKKAAEAKFLRRPFSHYLTPSRIR
ncbi:hypothetical protein DJ90_4965 [Paenibacillus macerans]|uniref:Uncharacterized protein n=1 Tax=Paenibacillus macerans TaxID=44252 RepID=A0A090ZXD9_PAEMA|nr:hypothetical protein DJ90_4965 [Paenibacillus macerans]